MGARALLANTAAASPAPNCKPFLGFVLERAMAACARSMTDARRLGGSLVTAIIRVAAAAAADDAAAALATAVAPEEPCGECECGCDGVSISARVSETGERTRLRAAAEAAAAAAAVAVAVTLEPVVAGDCACSIGCLGAGGGEGGSLARTSGSADGVPTTDVPADRRDGADAEP